jgi:signal transduction histidine kinase
VAQVAALNEPLVAKKGLSLNIDVVPEVPALVADREQVTHVVSNLLGNAIAFTPAGGRVWVAVRTSNDGASGTSRSKSATRALALRLSITTSCSASSRKWTLPRRADITAPGWA